MIQRVQSRLRGLYFLLTGILTVLLVSALLLITNFQAVSEQQSWVQHTYQVISEIDQIFSTMKDAESSLRGFLLTRDETYLGPYRQGRLSVWSHFNQLKALTKDNIGQQAHCKTLEEMLRSRLDIMEKNLAGLDTTKRGSVFFSEGRLTMEALRGQIETMKIAEMRLLEDRTETVNRSKIYFNWWLILAFSLSAIVITLGFLQIRKNQLAAIAEAHSRSQETWLKTNIADLAELVAGETRVETAGQRVIEHLAKRFHLHAASFYVLDDRRLRRIATYGTGLAEAVPSSLVPGENLATESLKHEKTFVISPVPENYLRISTTLGQAQPDSILIAPLKFQGRNIGFIEVAALDNTTESLRTVLDNVAETLGIGVSAALSREHLQSLFEKTQQQAEELQAQQEELRTNNEELEQQTRAMESQQQDLNLKNKQLEVAKRDIERKASDLEKASQYKSEFLAKMSHELRTPLNSLLILATLLMENKDGNLSDQQRGFARSIHGAGNDLLNLINDILDLSKIEARKLALRPESFSLRSVIDQMLMTFEPQAKAKGLELKSSSNADALVMHTDRQRLEQVLRNFLSNALKFTESGFIELSANDIGNGLVRWGVADSGIGIPAEKRDLIFEAFEQADGSVSRKYGGTGLGLTISRELAHLLGGEIRLESEEGKGSRFLLEIPRQIAPPSDHPKLSSPTPVAMNASAIPPQDSMREAQKALGDVRPEEKTILIVEDDETFRRSVAEAVRAYGFRPIETGHGETALSLLQQHTPSAILLDIKLPGVSGLGLLEMIKRMPHLRHVPIHIISAAEHQQSALRMGAMGYLGKPVTLDKIRSALSRIENLVSRKVRRLLIIEDDDRQRDAIKQLIAGDDIEINTVGTGDEAINALKEYGYDCVILDLTLPDVSGFELLDRFSAMDISLPPIVIYTGKDLTRQEEDHLRKFSESIIIKGAKSPERLLDEVNLFLHRVETMLPEDKREMLTQLRSRESAFEGKTVLLVDDDLRNVFALTAALEGRGLQVRIARDGFEALSSLEKFSDIDLILMDIMMPKMDGYEAMTRIRALPQHKALPIIALTAKAMKGDHEKCIEAGANDYLQKPINLTNLTSVLKVWLSPKEVFS